MLDMAILGLLNERTMHGYELKQHLPGLGLWRVSFGSVYPALKRLERRGFIESSSASGGRKEYAITEAGVGRFQAMLGDQTASVDNTTEFRVRLSLFRHLPAATRSLFFDRRIAVLRRRLSAIEATLGGTELDRYTRARASPPCAHH